jgi:tetratricopeptide (TPR) repeat protein
MPKLINRSSNSLKKYRMRKILIIMLFAVITPGIWGQQLYDYLLMAKALTDRNEAIQAVSVLSEVLTRQTDYRIYIERAAAYILMRDYEAAITDLQTANKLQNGSGSYGLAEVYAYKGDPATSLKFLKMNLATGLKKDEKEILLDPAFSKIEDTAEWKLFWKEDRYSAFETDLSELEYEVNRGDIEEAGMVLNSLITENPGNPGLIYAEALVAFSEEKYQKAIDVLVTVPILKMEEKNLRLLAKTQSSSGNYIGAALDYSELIKRETLDAGLLYLRAECYRKAGEGSKALSDLERFLALYPENGNALSMAGKIESETGDNIKALEYFSRNIEINPSISVNYIDRANAYFSSSSWKYAIDDYSMALDLEPGNADTYLNKGLSLINMGKIEDACHDLRQSLKLGNKKASSYISRYCIE